MPITTTPRRPRRSGAPAAARRLARTLRRLTHTLASAYADMAWVYRYGPGFAPTAPVRFAADAAPAAPAYRVRRLGTPGRRQAPARHALARQALARQLPARQLPASRSAAQASASA